MDALEFDALKWRVSVLEKWCVSLEERFGKEAQNNLAGLFKKWDQEGMLEQRNEEIK